MKLLLLCLALSFLGAVTPNPFGIKNPFDALPAQDAVQCSGTPNTIPVWDSEPVLVNTTKNGKLFLAGGDQVNPQINLVHVYGTPYDMGYAFGQLLGSELGTFLKEVQKWIDDMADSYVTFVPKPLRNKVINEGLNAALDLTAELTAPYTPQYFYDEMHGMADASGVDYQDILRVNMIPELIQASCSMFGAWGPSTANTDGTLYQLRALDWNTNGPFQKFPLVQVYHPASGYGHPFMNVGWVGFIGSITGYSSSPVGICEKVWYNYNGTYSRSGYPWHFLLRDILQFDQDIDNALTRIANAERTCSIFAGVGDGESNTFRALEYSHDYINIWNDKNFPAYLPAHPLMDGVVYLDKHTQPSHDPCLGDLLQFYYGNIDAHHTMQNITAQAQTGDTHIAVYDYAHSLVYVSNAGIYDPQTGTDPAYNRQFTKFDANELFLVAL